MVDKKFNRDEYIGLMRKNRFNCFPVPINQKAGDKRYQASRTIPDQPIKPTENYGILPTKDGHNGILDIDDKERYRWFAELMIKEGWMVIDSPHGWHIPFNNLSDYASKFELFDYSVQNTKIAEIQGISHYCIGAGSQIIDEDTGEVSEYVNRGSNKIWNQKGRSFEECFEFIMNTLSLTGVKEQKKAGSYKYLREQFIKGEIPKKKQSNDYFHQASRACLTEGFTKDEAEKKIKVVYDEWSNSKYFSNRSWYNVLSKINEVYENPDKFRIELGRKKKPSLDIDRTGIALKIKNERNIYSDPNLHEVYEDKHGFLEKINDTLLSELLPKYPQMETNDYRQIIFKLEGHGKPMPETNLDLVVFDNGKFNKKKGKLVKSDDIADMGFKGYNYLPPTKENEPKQFLKFFNSYPKHEHPRLKAGLKAIFSGYVDPRITVLHGISRVGKSAMCTILCKVLGEYAYEVDLKEFLSDRATASGIIGKRLVVFQDLPEEWHDLVPIKNITGEDTLNIRQFNKKAENTKNQIKIFASTNQLPEIDEQKKNAMYTARLSLMHNIEKKPFKEINGFKSKIAEEEGEKIISWILNIPDKECEYEDSATVEKEWEELANPEKEWLEQNFEPSTSLDNKMVVVSLLNEFKKCSNNEVKISQDKFTKSLKNLGYAVRDGVIKNIVPKGEVSEAKMGGLLA